jgi:hypothetical protein
MLVIEMALMRQHRAAIRHVAAILALTPPI